MSRHPLILKSMVTFMTTYNVKPHSHLCFVIVGCLQNADVVFMVDSSTSVGNTNFQKLEHFLKVSKDIFSKYISIKERLLCSFIGIIQWSLLVLFFQVRPTMPYVYGTRLLLPVVTFPFFDIVCCLSFLLICSVFYHILTTWTIQHLSIQYLNVML